MRYDQGYALAIMTKIEDIMTNLQKLDVAIQLTHTHTHTHTERERERGRETTHTHRVSERETKTFIYQNMMKTYC